MIYKQSILTINGNNAKLDEDIYLFRLDKNIELYFTIVNNKYKFNKSDLNNIINLTNASYFQMRLYKNAEVKYTFAIQPTDNGKAILTITDDLIDEPIEVGDYDFQISLLDADKSSMISLPIVSKQIHVCEPLVTDASETGTAVLGLSTLESGEIVDAFDEEGNYIRKVHVNGELISAELFNKWEEALETNSSNIKTLDSQFKDIANLFSTEQTTNSYKIKCGNKVIAEIPLGSITPKYTITNTLSHAINNNNTTEIEENQSYTATITAIEGYSINSVVITMGGADITNNVYNEGNINIPKVTGNLVINVSAIIIPKDFITDGLLFNLELRNRTSENNSTNPPIIVDTINNKECITHNIDWDGKTSGFVDNGLLLKDPSTIENANSFKEKTYSTLEIPKFDATYDFSNGFTLEFTLSGHKGRGIARSYGTANGIYGISMYHISRNLAEYFSEYIDTENKVIQAQLTDHMLTNDVVYNEDEHTYSISVDNNMNASSYLDGQLIDTINTTTASNFKKLFFPEVIKVSSLFVGFLYQNTDSRNFILSEMRLYNKVLSSDEIYSNYNKTVSLQTLSNF
nr:MAG TPA: hypothetical protein [Caudoviricetes sp.]